MDYAKKVSHDLTELTEHELSTIQAGLVLLANSGTAGTLSYPDYKRTAADMLGILDVNGYNHSNKRTTT